MRDRIVNILRKNGYKVTPQRLAICEYVLKSKEHPTAKKIYSEVRKKYPTVSLATIYQTLKILEKLNLIQELPFKEDVRIDSNAQPHINLVCLKCGKIEDLEHESARKVVEAASRIGFEVIKQRIDVLGICRECQTKK